jgi:PPOX class probable FMN-dependent enzyme
MPHNDPHAVATPEDLRALYGEASERVKAKKAQNITSETQRALEMAPFFVLATTDESGHCDASPRGGPPGLIQVLDETTIAFPDLTGNRLIDSLQNIMDTGRVGLLVVTPGNDETIRVDGRAHLTLDPEVTQRWDGLINRVRLGVVVSVDNVFVHCAMAFKRSSMWDPESWKHHADTPDMAVLFNEMTGSNDDPQAMRRALDADYAEVLASEQPGG